MPALNLDLVFPAKMFEAVQRLKATGFSCTPAMLAPMLKFCRSLFGECRDHLNYCVVNSAPITRETVAKIFELVRTSGFFITTLFFPGSTIKIMKSLPSLRFDEIIQFPHLSLPLDGYREGALQTPKKVQGRWSFGSRETDRIYCRSSHEELPFNAHPVAIGIVRLLRTSARDTAGGLCEKLGLNWPSFIHGLETIIGRHVLNEHCEQLEARLPSLSISRWPDGAYATDRNYWENLVGVKEYIDVHFGTELDLDSFVYHLRVAHVIYLMGPNLDSFYFPISFPLGHQVGEIRNLPGQFRNRTVSCVIPPELYNYCDAIAAREAVHPEKHGVHWGDLATTKLIPMGTKPNGDLRKIIFHPPVVITASQINSLHQLFARVVWALKEKNRETCRSATALFLKRFVCLHPFSCGNLGLAMVMINSWIARSEGKNVMHGYVDFNAHVLNDEAFLTYFEKLIDEFGFSSTSHTEIALSAARVKDYLFTLKMLSACAPARARDILSDPNIRAKLLLM